MPILWKPNGQMDINTEAADLPEQGDGKGSIQSGAMVRCKNLNVSRMGILRTRDGSSVLASFGALEPITYLFEEAGNRYAFGGVYSYKNETVIATGGKMETPEVTPGAGSYYSAQTVVLSCANLRADIYYTTDGTIPNQGSTRYTSAIIISLGTNLIFYAVDPMGFLSDSDYVSAYYADLSPKTITTENFNQLITETNNDNLTTEGG